MIITNNEARQLLGAKKSGLKTLDVSLDLGKTKSKVAIDEDYFVFPDGQKVDEEQLKKTLKKDAVCFIIRDNSVLKAQLFSDDTNKFYKLVPTADAPTVEISGIRMHVTKSMTPMQDTEKKIESIMPVNGFVLDTCMGLGYTAILASKTAEFVFTCEKDANIIEVAMHNPWSKELFNNKKISVINTSVFEQIKIFKSGMFDTVIHDPPRLTLATELYSLDFYKEVFRVLKNNGKLYHYTGNPGGKNRNVDLAANVMLRLRKAGFSNIKRAHFGVVAVKE
ncbi:MAG TPA: SAM-dependent methyltransferase [Candidatus Nanoarchaeia archaeon]|nr:SAM-dependent methyltransferase [Candidatus Nanoarchaeia archaeon]